MKHGDTCCTSIFVIGNCVALGFGIAFLVQAVSQIGYEYNLWWWNLVYCVILAVAIVNQLVKWFLTQKEVVEESDDSSDTTHVKATKHGKRLLTRYVYSHRNPVDTLILVALLGSFIWGCYVYARIGGGGSYIDNTGVQVVYNTQLWIWFQVMFWMEVAFMCLMCCLLSCFSCIACCTLVSGGTPALKRFSEV